MSTVRKRQKGTEQKTTEQDVLNRLTQWIIGAFVFGYLLGLISIAYQYLSTLQEPWKSLSVALAVVFIPVVVSVILSSIAQSYMKDSVSSMLKKAGEAAASEKIKFEETNTEKEIKKKEELELVALAIGNKEGVWSSLDGIKSQIYSDNLDPDAWKIIQNNPSVLPETQSSSIAALEALRFLAEDDLWDIIDNACRSALKVSDQQLEQPELKFFRSDVRTYLKAWLFCTIKNPNPVSFKIIKQRYSDKTAYKKVLQCIANLLAQDTQVLEKNETMKKRYIPTPDARKILTDKLNNELINKLP
ncbi:MAG: hypothetical protein OHK0047_22230 [Leptolyngbyaceae cyanobacterium]